MKKLFSIFHIPLLFLLLVGGSCRKKETPREQVRFDFLIPISVTPIKDTISVGEELTFSTLFSDSVYDMNSAKRYYLPEFNWKPLIFITKLVAPEKYYSDQPSAGSKFAYVNLVGSFTKVDNIGANMQYVYENNQYKITVKIKPKESGVFVISFSNDFSPGEIKLPQEFSPNLPGIIKEPVIGVMRNYVNNGQTNYNLLKQNCLVETPGITSTSTWLYKNSTYTFVVK